MPRRAAAAKVPADGAFPTSRWQVGDYVKETFTLKIPPSWSAGKASLGLRLVDEKRQSAPVAAGSPAQGGLAPLGELVVAPQAADTAEATPTAAKGAPASEP